MSESGAKQYRRMVSRMIRNGEDEILNRFVKDMKTLPIKKRFMMAMSILRGVRRK